MKVHFLLISVSYLLSKFFNGNIFQIHLIKFNFDVNTSRSSAEIFTRKLEFGTNSTDISNKIKFHLCTSRV